MKPATNEEALELLEEFRGCLHGALDATVWAQAMFTFGGEATWDAAKSVAQAAETLEGLSRSVEQLRWPDVFERVLP